MIRLNQAKTNWPKPEMKNNRVYKPEMKRTHQPQEEEIKKAPPDSKYTTNKLYCLKNLTSFN